MSGFISRWANRKAAQQREDVQILPDPSSAPASDGGLIEPEVAPLPSVVEGGHTLAPDELAQKLASLPSIDEITAGTDIRPFLQDFVPRALRNAAMRRAWLADPIISTHLDVARDYAWEFNAGPLPVGFSNGLSTEAIERGLEALDIVKPAPNPPIPDDSAEEFSAELPTQSELIDPASDGEIQPKLLESEEKKITQAAEPPTIIALSPKKYGSALPD